MNVKMMQRVLALLLCLVLLVMAPVRAYATGLEAVVGVVAVEALKVVIPALIAIGIAVGIDQGVFEDLGVGAMAHLKDNGFVNDDGTIDVTIANGKSYVGEDLIQTLRDWLFDTEVVSAVGSGTVVSPGFTITDPGTTTYSPDQTCYFCGWYEVRTSDTKFCYAFVPIDLTSEITATYTNSTGTNAMSRGRYDLGGMQNVLIPFSISIRTSVDVPASAYAGLHNLTGLGLNTSAAIQHILSISPEVKEVTTVNDLTLGNVAPDDEDLQVGYPGWTANAYIIEGGGGSEDPKEDKYLYRVSVFDDIDFSISQNQDEAQQGDTDIVIEDDPEQDPTTVPGSGSDPDSGADTDPGTSSGTISQVQADTFWEKLAAVLKAPFELLGNMLLEGIEAIFVPSADFLTEKVEAIRAEFAFADAIMTTGDFFRTGLADLGTEPPIIYIDLGATEGSYNIGGKVVFVDMSWYERYKPTGDAILASFLWIVFAWRMLLKIPSVIRGSAGAFNVVSADQIGRDGGDKS